MNERETIAAIVEGPGDEGALEVVLRRWFGEKQIHTSPVIRTLTSNGVDRLLAPYDAHRQIGVEYYVDKVQRWNPCAILILLDADKECTQPRRRPARTKLGPWLKERAQSMVAHIPVGVVVADRRFESWFLCDPCQQALYRAGIFQRVSLRPDVVGAQSAEPLRVLLGEAYSKRTDQKRLAHKMPLTEEMAAASRSFRKLLKELEMITTILQSGRSAPRSASG